MKHYLIAILLFVCSFNAHASFDEYVDVILDAAEIVGVDPTLMVVIAHQETRFRNIPARAGGTAEGLFQFNDITWRHVLSRYGEQYGVAIDASKYDVLANSIMSAAYIKENVNTLTRILGREPTYGEIYMAHLLGPTGARRLLSAPTTDIAASVVSYAYPRNRPLFVTASGKHRTTGQFRDMINWRIHRLYVDYSETVEQVLISRNQPPKPLNRWDSMLSQLKEIPNQINRVKEHPLFKEMVEYRSTIAYHQSTSRYAG